MSDVKEATQEKRSFDAEVSKVLQLMINAIYTNKDIFLRELISNASDACDKLRYQSITQPELLDGDAELKITLELDAKKRQIIITDNGIGMDRDDMIANLGTIARSGTSEFASSITGDDSKDSNLIGQFGVGFYSAFMVAEKVRVESRKAGTDQSWVWTSDGSGEFTVESSPKEFKRGTRIILTVRKAEKDYLDKFKLEHIAKTYSDHIAFPIELIDSEENSVNVLNKASAIWARPKSEITDEEYQEFYKHASHLPDTPWLTLHSQVEGALSYTYLLYVPSMKPFDLYHPDRMRRVKLYVKRVFITEEGVDIIPQYLRFLRGVVDSEDLPLNISRETLQHNMMVEKIQRSITKKVLSELKKKGKDAESYATFWEHFGPVLKEGLCEPTTEHEKILEVCRFHSTEKPGELVSLDQYIERMPEGQEHIYFLTGDEVEVMRHNPQLEGFKQKGYEVLLLDDHVDTFWTSVVSAYKDKPLRSITKTELKDTSSEVDDADKNQEELASEAKMQQLMAALKELYGEDVRDIRLTSKLTDSPVCIAIDEGDMDIRMERFLVENKQILKAMPKILELNPKHRIVQSLADMEDKQSEPFKDIAFLLLDQARLIEGEDIRDPALFAKRMNGFIEQGML